MVCKIHLRLPQCPTPAGTWLSWIFPPKRRKTGNSDFPLFLKPIFCFIDPNFSLFFYPSFPFY